MNSTVSPGKALMVLGEKVSELFAPTVTFRLRAWTAVKSWATPKRRVLERSILGLVVFGRMNGGIGVNE
jgi:hypothetical protein